MRVWRLSAVADSTANVPGNVEGGDVFIGTLTLINGRYYPSQAGPRGVGYKPTHSYPQRNQAIRHLLLKTPQAGAFDTETEPAGEAPTEYGKELTDDSNEAGI